MSTKQRSSFKLPRVRTDMDTPTLPENATQQEIEDYLQKLIDLELMNGQGVLLALEAVIQSEVE